MDDLDDEIDTGLVFETTTDPMAIVDVSDERGQIVSVNGAFERRFDCAGADAQDADLTTVIGELVDTQLRSRIRPGVEVETTVSVADHDGGSLLRVRPLDAEGPESRSLVVITDPPGGKHGAGPVGEIMTADARLRPVVEIARAEDPSVLRDATADLLRDGFRFDSVVIDLGHREPLTTNIGAPVTVPRSGDDSSGITAHDWTDDPDSERRSIAVIESIGDSGDIETTVCTAESTDPRVPEAVELLGEYVGAVLDRIDRERELHAERRELAIFNQILRHEVMNGLNLVRARVDLLERDISQANREHYETARRRIDDMIDQVQAVRELVHDETVETEAWPVADVVREPVQHARENHPEASFSVVGSVPDFAVEIDDLIHFCLRTVLRNSVQHADIDDPAVRIDVSRTNGFAAIRIADNGPGIPEDLDRSVFGEGVSSLDDEGHGQGLFLTRRIVEDIHGGGVRVDESERGGAEFEIKLPVAEE